jgi:hypothetical protein
VRSHFKAANFSANRAASARRRPERRLKVSQPVVVPLDHIRLSHHRLAGVPHQVGDTHAVLPQQPQLCRLSGAVGSDDTPLSGGQHLARVETETGQRAVLADWPPLVAAAQGAGRILQDRQPAPLPQVQEPIQVRRHADLMYDQDGFCA